MHESLIDAVDGSSTGTRVPRMWALLGLPTERLPATMRSRLPAPVQPETRPMPTNNGAWLHDRQRIAHFREQPIQTNEYQSVDGTEGKFLWSSSPQNVD